LVVYPAAGLVNFPDQSIPKFIVDKQVPYTSSLYNITAIEKPATEGVKIMMDILLSRD